MTCIGLMLHSCCCHSAFGQSCSVLKILFCPGKNLTYAQQLLKLCPAACSVPCPQEKCCFQLYIHCCSRNSVLQPAADSVPCLRETLLPRLAFTMHQQGNLCLALSSMRGRYVVLHLAADYSVVCLQVGGFLQRIDYVRKHAFGVMCILKVS